MWGMLSSVPIQCWPLDATPAMTDNCRESSHWRHPLETEQTEEQPTFDGLRGQIEELRASRARLALVADAERRDIERALHEGVQQDLVGLAANLEVAAGSLESDPAAAMAILDEMQRVTRRALTEMQELANRVFPALLEAGGLVPELRAAASRAGVPTRVDVDAKATVPPELAGAVYFCALDVFEGAPNGTPVAVHVRSEPETLIFEVVAECDLGAERRAPHDRVEALGGHVTITSEGNRTTVAGSLPLPR
jgi:signal transduction histidine kinase